MKEEFVDLPLKTKITRIFWLGNDEFKMYFYLKEMRNPLLSDWKTFKEEIVSFCTDNNLESILKYKEGSWYRYLVRLKDQEFIWNATDREILDKLKKEFVPKIIQSLFYTLDNNLKKLINIVKEMSEFYEKNTQKIKYIKPKFRK